MGHAGAIWTDGQNGAEDKIKAWSRAGIRIADNPGDLGWIMLEETRHSSA